MGPSGAGAILPFPLESPKCQGKEKVVATDSGNDKVFRIHVTIIIDVLALTVISQPPSHGKGIFRGCGSMLCTWLWREDTFC